MLREGHVGVVLALYAPFGLALAQGGFLSLAVTGAILVVTLATLPDVDLKIPLIEHRGVTHTIWFGVFVGVIIGGCGAVLALRNGVSGSIGIAAGMLSPAMVGALGVGAFGFGVGFLAVVGHVVGDALTPMGVRPYAPVSRASYSLDVARATNPLANYLLLVLGLAVAGGALYLSAPAAT